ncbi:MAG TPA: hypothetical protein VH593_19670 [Ktedonobacteraceae bacterium]|jgi:hypothetical protein
MKWSSTTAISEQHDDHIWLTVNGRAWAIRAIIRTRHHYIFQLWRGYSPNLEHIAIECINVDWEAYCEAAIEMLREAHPCMSR